MTVKLIATAHGTAFYQSDEGLFGAAPVGAAAPRCAYASLSAIAQLKGFSTLEIFKLRSGS